MEQNSNLSDLFKPQDVSRTIEHAMNVFQGRHESLPELLKEAGSILTRVSKKFTPKQMVMVVGGLAVAAIIVISLTESSDDHDNESEKRNQNRNQS
jgi:hypothetical protein